MSTINGRFVRTLLCSASLLAYSAAAHAQQQQAVEEIIVTGTNIRGAEVIGSAVQTISADSIAESGKATLAELLRELPVNFAGGVANSDNNRGGQDTSSAGANLTGGSGVNLRGLGALSTLVLVDGRRVAASGQFGDFVDISNIPVAAIERLEVLQDGASAVYGSDAVGGVVNIILKRNFEGNQTLVRGGTTTEGGGTEFQASHIYGKGWDTGNIVLGYEYNKRSRVQADDRDFNGGNFSDRGGVNWPRYTNRAGTAANIFSGGAAFNGNVAFTVPAGSSGVGLTVAQLQPAAGGFGNNFDPWNDYDILPNMERQSLFANIDQDLTDNLSFHGGVRYTNREGDYRIGNAVIFSNVPSTNPAFITGVTNNFGVVIDERTLRRDVGVDSYALDGGLSYAFADDWNADLSVSYSRENQRRQSNVLRDTNIGERLANGTTAPSSLACSLMGLNRTNIGSIVTPSPAQAFCANLNYATYNPYSTQDLSPQVLDQILGYEDLEFRSWVAQATFKVDGTLAELPGGDMKLAAGVDYREEEISGDLNFNYRSISPLSIPYGATKRKVTSVFGELAVPVVGADNAMPGVYALDLSAAVRHENSDGLGDYKTTDPKLGLRYKPVEDLALRASWGTSFHAPPMRFAYTGPQPVPGGNAIFYANAFYTAPCNTTLVQLNGFTGTPGGPGNCTFTGMVVSGGAGPVLRPETADTWTLGADLTPAAIPGLKLSANYFNLKVKDRLVRITSGTLGGILANYFATGSSPYINNLVFNPNVALTTSLFNDPRFTGLAGPGPTRTPAQVAAIIYATQTNLASLHMDGFDFGFNYAFETADSGDFDVFFNGTLLTKYKVQGVPGGPFDNKLGRYESTGNPVKFKSKQGIGWSGEVLSALANVNYTSGYKCYAGCFVPDATGAPVANTTPIDIGSWTTLDLQFSADLSKVSPILNDAELSFSVLNVFDKDPPFIDTGRIATGNAPEPYDTANHTIIGRSLSLTLTKKW
ncbi:MAG: TonB-dependent receptor [Rhodospirillaceae bacterium]|nr:TonB-dependent receptor [Rhodospirillaceae bacterium]